jgi:outer membrane protein TolC
MTHFPLATLLALALPLPPGSANETPIPRLDPCQGVEAPAPIPLAEVWREARPGEAGFRAAGREIEAREAARSSVARLRAPAFDANGIWNYGQRTSPGEERVLGVGGRGDLRLLGSWTVVEGGMGARARAATADLDAARAGASAFETGWAANLARSWSAALLAEREVERLEAHAEALDGLAPLVRQRVDAGVEASWDERLLDEARARTGRRLAEAQARRAAFRAELAGLVGRCVRPAAPPLGEDPLGSIATAPTSPPAPGTAVHPEVTRLLLLADARSARARAEADVGRWQFGLVGSAGPTRSRAFDPGPVEHEYLVGVSGQVRLDLAGVARQNRRAGEGEAAALRARAEGLGDLMEREAQSVAASLDHARERGDAAQREADRTAATLDAARLRWEAGVDGWSSLVQALERDLDARLALAAWEYDLLLLRIRRSELSGSMDSLVTTEEFER